MELLFLIGGFALGLLLVFLITSITYTTGEFTINYVDPEDEFMKLHIDNQDHLHTKKYILLKIVRKEDASK